jgi:O-antigen/teichoic acid export membrane protein
LLFAGAGLSQVWTAMLLFTALAAGASIAVAVHAARRAKAECGSTPAATSGKDAAAVRDQLRFVLILIAADAYLWLCPVLLSREATLTEVGGFNVAMQVPSLISFLSTSLEVIYVPKIAAYWHAGRLEEIRPLLRSGCRLMLIAGVPLTAALIAFGPRLLGLSRPNHSATFPAMLEVLAAQAISVFCGPCGYLVLLTGRENLNLGGMLLALAGILCVAAFASAYGPWPPPPPSCSPSPSPTSCLPSTASAS